MNRDATGEDLRADVKQKIIQRYSEIKASPPASSDESEDVVQVQAAKLFEIDLMAEDVYQ
jgi:hypothetical protein